METGEPVPENGEMMEKGEHPDGKGLQNKGQEDPSSGEIKRSETPNTLENEEEGSRPGAANACPDPHEVSHQVTFKGVFPGPSRSRPTKKTRLERTKPEEEPPIAKNGNTTKLNAAEGSEDAEVPGPLVGRAIQTTTNARGSDVEGEYNYGATQSASRLHKEPNGVESTTVMPVRKANIPALEGPKD